MYRLTNSSVVIRVHDMAFIPACVDNVDYQAYLLWLSAGNVPEAALS